MAKSIAKTRTPSRILIADDNGPNVELLEAYLAGLDCQIAVAVDGQDTLAKVDPRIAKAMQQWLG